MITSGNYRTVALADLDNDGHLDVIGGGSKPATITIWYGDGHGRLFEFQSLPLTGDIRSVAVGDMDNDGYKDLVFSIQREEAGIRFWKNHAGRKWTRGNAPANAFGFEGARTADVNLDGFEDIIASGEPGGIKVWMGDGQGNWLIESGPTKDGFFMDIETADFDNDGKIDLAGAGWGAKGSLRVWFGDGTGGWFSIAPLAMGSFYALSTGDINSDGNIDIFAGSYRKGIYIFLGDGKGNFTIRPSPTDEGSYWKVLPIDLNGDNRLDLVASSINAQGIKAWINEDGDKWSEMEGQFPSRGVFYGMASGDLNGDGRNDLLAASFAEGIKVWMGKGRKPLATVSQRVRRIPAARVEKDLDENDVYKTIDGVSLYKIGPKDVLDITLWTGNKKEVDEVTVREDGTITFKFVEDLKIANLTTIELDERLSSALKKFIKKPRFDIVVKEYDSKFVVFYGQIASPWAGTGPGRYALTGKITLLDMLTKIGGPTNDANLNLVLVRSKGGASRTVNLFDAIIKGGPTQNIILNDGDRVTLPSIAKAKNRIYIYGEVGSPGMYPFTGRSMRMMDAISLAGNLTIFAKEEHTRVVRGDISRPEVISIDLEALLERGDHTQNIALTNGDFVYVPRTVIGDADRFLRQINVLIDLITKPAQIRDIVKDSPVLVLP